jgi:hypothetical protein
VKIFMLEPYFLAVISRVRNKVHSENIPPRTLFPTVYSRGTKGNHICENSLLKIASL